MPFSATAPGKLILIGEYAVLHGAPALVSAVDRRVTVDISPKNGASTLTIPHIGLFSGKMDDVDNLSPTVSAESAPFADPQLRSVRNIISCFHRMIGPQSVVLPSMALTIDARPLFAHDGLKLGLGSSAALTVALLAGLFYHTFGKLIGKELLLECGQECHRYLQGGMGSGIDVAASIFGGIVAYRIDPGSNAEKPRVNSLDPLPALSVVAVWKGHSASTPRLLSGLDDFNQSHPSIFRKQMDRLSAASQLGVDAYRSMNHVAFMESIDRFFSRLIQFADMSGLPIVTGDDMSLANVTKRCGGVYKPSGAGGGDVGLAFTNDPSTVGRLNQAFTDAGYHVLDLKTTAKGVEL